MYDIQEDTRGINLLKSNPKTALRKLSLPIIISMLLISLYNIVDSIWIAGLGADSLTAMGFVIPIQLIIIGVGVGLGAGSNAVISKYIGARDKLLADNASVHSILLSIFTSIILSVIILFYIGDIYLMMGARGEILKLAIGYSQIYFAGSIFVIFPEALYGLLRAEGDVNRTMYAMGFCGIINMILDPIFIYTFDFQMNGAAIATLISLSLVLVVMLYWIYVKQDTFLKPHIINFTYDLNIIKDILNVALSASIEFLFISIVGIIMNWILLMVAGSDLVAVYQIGWRLISFAMQALVGISTALITVVGFNYGAKNVKNIKIAFNYANVLSTIIGVFFVIILFVFRSELSYIFAYSSTSTRLFDDFCTFLVYFSLTFFTFPIGINSTYIFQGFGKGLTSLILSIIREVVGASVFAYVFGVILQMGIDGIWLGNLVGYSITSLIAYAYAKYFIKQHLKVT